MQARDIAPWDRATDNEEGVVGAGGAQGVGGLLGKGHMGAAENAQPDDLHILLQGGGGDGLGALANSRVDHLEPGLAQGAGDELGTTVVAVQARLGDQNSHRHQKTTGWRNSPHWSLSTSTISPTVQYALAHSTR